MNAFFDRDDIAVVALHDVIKRLGSYDDLHGVKAYDSDGFLKGYIYSGNSHRCWIVKSINSDYGVYVDTDDLYMNRDDVNNL